MIPELRRKFNASFLPNKYKAFQERLNRRCGTEIHFRVSETPCFFPESLLDKMTMYGQELISQLLASSEYRRASDASVPAEFNAPGEGEHPLFVSVDFGLV